MLIIIKKYNKNRHLNIIFIFIHHSLMSIVHEPKYNKTSATNSELTNM